MYLEVSPVLTRRRDGVAFADRVRSAFAGFGDAEASLSRCELTVSVLEVSFR